MTAIERIQKWFASQCNGDWEHIYGVSIESTDNPGWMIKMGIAETPAANTTVKIKRDGYEIEPHGDILWAYCNADKLNETLDEIATILEAHPKS